MSRKFWVNLILIAIAIAICVVPLVIVQDSEFGGADGAATDAIAEVDPEFEPWFEHIWSPPGGETESLLFALQAALGAAVLFGGLGYLAGVAQGKKQAGQPTADQGAGPAALSERAADAS